MNHFLRFSTLTLRRWRIFSLGIRRGGDGACMDGDNGQVVIQTSTTRSRRLIISIACSSCSSVITPCQPDILIAYCTV